jgi:hypothetical protein
MLALPWVIRGQSLTGLSLFSINSSCKQTYLIKSPITTSLHVTPFLHWCILAQLSAISWANKLFQGRTPNSDHFLSNAADWEIVQVNGWTKQVDFVMNCPGWRRGAMDIASASGTLIFWVRIPRCCCFPGRVVYWYRLRRGDWSYGSWDRIPHQGIGL